MEYEAYTRFTRDAARRLAQGDLRRASVILQGLLVSDISDLDKAEICSTMAAINQKLEQDSEALGWYDEGIAYEHPHRRFALSEQKAERLAELGRREEALRIYKDLLTRPYLMEADKHRLRRCIECLPS